MLTDGMPADRDELQKLLNAAYRKGNQDAHAARDILVKLVPAFDERADIEQRAEIAEGRLELLSSTNMQLLADIGRAKTEAARTVEALRQAQDHWLVKLAIRISGWFSR